MIDPRDLFAKAGLEKSADFFSSYEKLVALFLDWNTKINLSAIRDEEGVWKKHLIDSLLATKHVEIKGKVLDLGTGGGWPCLPLAITKKSADFLALDSVGKKLKVVQAMADELGLENVQTIHTRAEDLGQDKKYREQFNMVVTRAVAPWPVLLELCLPFLKIGGKFIAYQGPAIHEDLKIYKHLEQKLGGKIVQLYKDELEGEERVFVEIKKIKSTPKHYPRPVSAAIRKSPLK